MPFSFHSKNTNTTMIHTLYYSSNFLILFLIFVLSPISSSTSKSLPFNISHFLYPIINYQDQTQTPSSSRPPFFLKDVLKGIAEREKWDLDDLRISTLDVKKLKFGTLRKYEFRVGVGKMEFVFMMSDEVSEWKSFHSLDKNEFEFEALVKEIGSKATLDVLKIQGPFELYATGDDYLSLTLPRKSSYMGLKKILVDEGITVEVKGADEISVLNISDLLKLVNGSILTKSGSSRFGNNWQSSCIPLLPVHAKGSASILAYITRNPDLRIETTFLSRRTLKLLSEKCYTRHTYREFYNDFLAQKIISLEKVLKSFLGGKKGQVANVNLLKLKVKDLTLFHFQLELERGIRSDDTYWTTLGEWRTRPTVERSWFEVTARFEAEVLKPRLIKEVRPFTEVDTSPWSNLMSNMSFTKISSFLVPPEPLTLDVRW